MSSLIWCAQQDDWFLCLLSSLGVYNNQFCCVCYNVLTIHQPLTLAFSVECWWNGGGKKVNIVVKSRLYKLVKKNVPWPLTPDSSSFHLFQSLQLIFYLTSLTFSYFIALDGSNIFNTFSENFKQFCCEADLYI